MSPACDQPWRFVRMGDLTPAVEARRDGTTVVRTAQPLDPYPVVLTDRLMHWAARRRIGRCWRGARPRAAHLRYGDAARAVRAIGQALIDRRGLSADRPVAILSGNDREHALLALAAQHVGIPVCADLARLFERVARFRHVDARPCGC